MNDVRAATIGKFLRDARVSAGLTQRDVSAKMGYTSAQFVSNWERGVCAPPHPHAAKARKDLAPAS